jgi:hypothetical protein
LEVMVKMCVSKFFWCDPAGEIKGRLGENDLPKVELCADKFPALLLLFYGAQLPISCIVAEDIDSPADPEGSPS